MTAQSTSSPPDEQSRSEAFEVAPSALRFGVAFFLRDFKVRIRRARLGVLWALAPTIVLALMAMLIAGEYGAAPLVDLNAPYPLFVVTGLVAWNVFSDGVHQPVTMCRRGRSILRHSPFPHEALLVAAVCFALFNLLLNSVLITGLLLFYGWPVSWAVLALVFVIPLLMMLGLVIGMFLAPISVIYLDIRYALPLLLTVLILACPVFYPVGQDTAFSVIMQVNPLTPFIEAFRHALLSGDGIGLDGLVAISVVLVALFYVSYRFYKRAMKIAIEHI